MRLVLEKAGPGRGENPTPLRSWLRQYGPLVGLALMGVRAVVIAVVVVLSCVGAWT
jgi:hypothetical protein